MILDERLHVRVKAASKFSTIQVAGQRFSKTTVVVLNGIEAAPIREALLEHPLLDIVEVMRVEEEPV